MYKKRTSSKRVYLLLYNGLLKWRVFKSGLKLKKKQKQLKIKIGDIKLSAKVTFLCQTVENLKPEAKFCFQFKIQILLFWTKQ